MFFKLNKPDKPKNNEYYYDELRGPSRIQLKLTMELIFTVNDELFRFECEAQNISDVGICLRFSTDRNLLPSNSSTVELQLPNIKQKDKIYDLKGRFVWSKRFKNKENDSFYILCGIRFEEKLPFSIQFEQIVISTLNTWEKLLAFYRQKLSKEQNDPLKQLSAIWPEIKNDIPEFAFIDCVFWYYYEPQDAFIKNSMYMEKDQDLYQINDNSVRKHLMETNFPLLESEFAQRVLSPISDEKELLGNDETSLSEWFFPLFDGEEFLGLVQFQFKKEIGLLLQVDRIFWLCTHISNYISTVIKSEELKSDNDYKDILSQIMGLSRPQCKKGALDKFYETVLTKFTRLMGDVPSFLQLFSEGLFIDEHGVYVRVFTICAIKNPNNTKISITAKRNIGNDGDKCCPLTLRGAYKPDFCSVNCSPKKNTPMYCVPLFNTINKTNDNIQREPIALACFAVSKKFQPTKRFKRRISEVSESLSQLLQNGIQSYLKNQERSLLERQGKLLKKDESGSQGLLVDLLREIRDIMSAKVCTLFWKNIEENYLYTLGTSMFEYYKTDSIGNKIHRIDFNEEFESFAKPTYDLKLNYKNLTSRVAIYENPISVDLTKKWHDDSRVDAIIHDTSEDNSITKNDGPFLGVPIFCLNSNDKKEVVGVLRCSKKNSQFRVFNRYDAELLTNMGRAITPLLISINDRTQSSKRVIFGTHEIRNFANLLIQDSNKDFRQYTKQDISNAAKLIRIYIDDMKRSDKTKFSWKPDKDKLFESRLFHNIIAPAVGLTNFYLDNKWAGVYKDVIKAQYQKSWEKHNPFLKVDIMRVIQIVFNLLNNAVKHSILVQGCYTYRNRIYRKDKIYITPWYNADKNVLAVEIINNGYPIEESEREKVFSFGYRGILAEEKSLGEGMGLNICKQIINVACEVHGLKAIELDLPSLRDPVVFSLAFDLNRLGR